MASDNAPGRPPTPDPADLFKAAMATFPSGVTIVTTADAQGRWWGFTATSFCAVSLAPPLVLVCLDRGAECHPVFETAERWIVHVIQPGDSELALRFATRGADKFADDAFTADARGLPRLSRASVTLDCARYAVHEGGDHTILLGRVEDSHVGAEAPVVYFRRRFHPLPATG